MRNSPANNYNVELSRFYWLNKPEHFSINDSVVTIGTGPETDFWQRTHYGFSKNNAPALLTEVAGDFTFSVRAKFRGNAQYDQCGILMYHDEDNWVKVSIEAENEEFSRIGSVVTNLGFSDWASTDIPSFVDQAWYRLSRRGRDFLVEFSEDGLHFHQMRMFHFPKANSTVQVGVYACSPMKSSFRAVFSDFRIGSGEWV